jgi:hypothetical protein
VIHILVRMPTSKDLRKGLGLRQLQVLGLAVAIARLHRAGLRGYPTQPGRGGRFAGDIPTVHASGDGELDPRLFPATPNVLRLPIAIHIIGGIPLLPGRPARPRQHARRLIDPGLGWAHLEETAAAISERGVMANAVIRLVKRGLLGYAVYDPRGYLLTEAGLELGLRYELTVPDLDRRLWLVCSGAKDRHAAWRLDGEALPAPVLPESRPELPEIRQPHLGKGQQALLLALARIEVAAAEAAARQQQPYQPPTPAGIMQLIEIVCRHILPETPVARLYAEYCKAPSNRQLARLYTIAAATGRFTSLCQRGLIGRAAVVKKRPYFVLRAAGLQAARKYGLPASEIVDLDQLAEQLAGGSTLLELRP